MDFSRPHFSKIVSKAANTNFFKHQWYPIQARAPRKVLTVVMVVVVVVVVGVLVVVSIVL